MHYSQVYVLKYSRVPKVTGMVETYAPRQLRQQVNSEKKNTTRIVNDASKTNLRSSDDPILSIS